MSIVNLHDYAAGSTKITVSVNGRTFDVDTSKRTMLKVHHLHRKLMTYVEFISAEMLGELTGQPFGTFIGLPDGAAQQAASEIIQSYLKGVEEANDVL